MNAVIGHLSRCFIAGIVALLPIGGLVVTVAYLEYLIAGSWLKDQPFYFPGVGLLAVSVLVYLIGLFVTTFIGQWLWRRVDALLDHVPALGRFYQTLKQILGYGSGTDAFFQRVVLVRNGETGAEELGLVTNAVSDGEGGEKLVVFIPGSPNPTIGRLTLADAVATRPVKTPVDEVMKALISVGKTPLHIEKDGK